jgi:hypothetical protein
MDEKCLQNIGNYLHGYMSTQMTTVNIFTALETSTLIDILVIVSAYIILTTTKCLMTYINTSHENELYTIYPQVLKHMGCMRHSAKCDPVQQKQTSHIVCWSWSCWLTATGYHFLLLNCNGTSAKQWIKLLVLSLIF